MGWSYNPIRGGEESNSVVLLEQIKDVHKLVVQEAHFSEIYDYKDYWFYDLSPFRKKALIRVTAKVTTGFDMEKVEIKMNDETKVITFLSLPPAEILSIDHELDYFDMQEGTFNQFDEKKITELSQSAKDFIKEKAIEAGLMEQAEQRKSVFIQQATGEAKMHGWQVVVEPDLLLN